MAIIYTPPSNWLMNKRSDAKGATEIDLSLISIPDTGRNHHSSLITQMAVSVEVSGLLHPILVSGAQNGRHILVAGKLRCLAFERLGRITIPAIVLPPLSKEQQELVTLAENVDRSELSVLEKAQELRRREMLLMANLAVQVAQGILPDVTAEAQSLSASARLLGVTREELRRARLIDQMTPEAKAKAVKENLGNNQRVLLQVAKKHGQKAQLNALAEIAIKKHAVKTRLRAAKASRDDAEQKTSDPLMNDTLALPCALDRRDPTKHFDELALAWSSSSLRPLFTNAPRQSQERFVAWLQEQIGLASSPCNTVHSETVL